MGHFRLWQRALDLDLAVCLVFEDDARPCADAVTRLQKELECLKAQNIHWDAGLTGLFRPVDLHILKKLTK